MKVGMQILPLLHEFFDNPLETLETIGGLGYRYVELIDQIGHADRVSGTNYTPKQIVEYAQQTGISFVGAHIGSNLNVPPKPLLDIILESKDEQKAIVEYYSNLKCPTLAMAEDYFPSKDYLLKRCEMYNQFGEMLAEAGIQLLYHTHFYDFQTFDDKYILDIMMEQVESEFLKLEIDAYWTIIGGMNPADVIRKYGKRVSILHIKDYPYDRLGEINIWDVFPKEKPVEYKTFWEIVKPETFVEIGYGAVKIQDIINAGNDNEVPYILMEQTYP